MKRILVFVLAAFMLIGCFTGCNEKPAADKSSETDSDWEYIKNKGELVVGITLFAPMNYEDEKGELVGFETEFAKAVGEKLGISVKFQEIDWNSKEIELNAKSIDCIWNGMTIDEDRKNNMEISVPYMQNKQVVVVKSENAEKFKDPMSFNGVQVVAESGSAGEMVATKDQYFAGVNFTPVSGQSNVLMEVFSGTADIGLIDYVMSIGSIGEGTDYSELTVLDEYEFQPEEYGIAFRKGSDVVAKVNSAISELAADGTLNEIAEKYKLQDLLLVK